MNFISENKKIRKQTQTMHVIVPSYVGRTTNGYRRNRPRPVIAGDVNVLIERFRHVIVIASIAPVTDVNFSPVDDDT